MSRLTLLALLLPAFALAQGTIDVPYQGRLTDAAGTPLSAITNVTFRVFRSEDPGADQTALWSVTQSLGLSDGYYSTRLPLPLELFDGSERYLELVVGEQPLRPRLKVGWAPYAGWCKNVAGDHVATTSLRVTSAQAAPGSGRVSGLPQSSSLTGDATAFTRELEPGDVLTVDPSTNGGVLYRVLTVVSDTEVTVAPAVISGFVNKAFSVQKTFVRVDRAGDQPTLTVAATGDVGIGTAIPAVKLHVAGSAYVSGVVINGDQGGALELGLPPAVGRARNPIDGGVPYIDFHFGNGQAEDYNARIINDAEKRLSLVSDVHVTGALDAQTFNGMAVWEKGGNNGTVSCDEFCEGSQWGRTGTCISAKRGGTNGAGISCATVAGLATAVRCLCSSF